MHLINSFQKKTLKDCYKYLRYCKNKDIDISVSPLCFFTVWGKNPGLVRLKKIWGTRHFSDIIYLFKNILSISKNYDLKIYNKNFNLKKIKKANVIVSYSHKDNFDKNGHFNDPYFNASSKKNKNNLWFLISLDNYLPKKIDDNIFLLLKKNKFKFSIFYLFKKIYYLFIENNFSLLKFLHYCWYEYDFAIRTKNLFFETFKNVHIKKLVLNYENIPFQNYLIKAVKKEKSKNTITIGYLHCAPWPLQIDLINRNVFLDKLYVSSEDQRNVLIEHLGWKNKKILNIPSLRFHKNKKKEFNGFIFPPYNLSKKNNYLERFEAYLKDSPNGHLNKLKVRIHPLNKDSVIHKNIKIKINDILLKYNKKFSNKNEETSIFFGSATGVCIQALEEGTKIIHFPENELTDVFTNFFWKNIIIKQKAEGVYVYNLSKFKKLFTINKEKNKFNKYLRL